MYNIKLTKTEYDTLFDVVNEAIDNVNDYMKDALKNDDVETYDALKKFKSNVVALQAKMNKV